MARTLDTPPRPTDPPSVASTRRSSRAPALAVGATVVVAVLVIVWVGPLGDRTATQAVDTAAFDAAVAIEGGVVPLVSDRVGELGSITAVRVTRTADPVPGRAHLLTRCGETCDGERPELLVHVVDQPAELDATGRLADGRPYETGPSTWRTVSLFTVGGDGRSLMLVGREMELAELVALAAGIDVDPSGVERVVEPDGWTDVGAVPMPPWHLGMTTAYELEGGRRLVITVERATPGRAALAAFGDNDQVELGLGGWAYRYRPPNSGLLFERGDLVVEVAGELTEGELRLVAHSLREMLPGEHPIAEPAPF